MFIGKFVALTSLYQRCLLAVRSIQDMRNSLIRFRSFWWQATENTVWGVCYTLKMLAVWDRRVEFIDIFANVAVLGRVSRPSRQKDELSRGKSKNRPGTFSFSTHSRSFFRFENWEWREEKRPLLFWSWQMALKRDRSLLHIHWSFDRVTAVS